MYIDGITIPVFEVAITFQKCWKSFFFDPVNTLFTIETLLEDKWKRKSVSKKFTIQDNDGLITRAILPLALTGRPACTFYLDRRE